MIQTARTPIFLITLITLLVASLSRAAVNEEGDWQFWTQEVATYPISDHLTGAFDIMFRIGDNATELWYQHYDAGIIFKTTDWLSIKPSFRLKRMKVGPIQDNLWQQVNNPSLNLLFSHQIGNVKLKNNCRFSYWDYLDNSTNDDIFYYRNILTLISPWSVTTAQITPYIREDFFFNIHTTHIERNRFSIGVLSDNSNTITPSAYIMLRSYKASDGWRDNYIIGLDVQFKF